MYERMLFNVSRVMQWVERINNAMQGSVRGHGESGEREAERPITKKLGMGSLQDCRGRLQFAVFQELQDCRIFRSCRSCKCQSYVEKKMQNNSLAISRSSKNY